MGGRDDGTEQGRYEMLIFFGHMLQKRVSRITELSVFRQQGLPEGRGHGAGGVFGACLIDGQSENGMESCGDFAFFASKVKSC